MFFHRSTPHQSTKEDTRLSQNQKAPRELRSAVFGLTLTLGGALLSISKRYSHFPPGGANDSPERGSVRLAAPRHKTFGVRERGETEESRANQQVPNIGRGSRASGKQKELERGKRKSKMLARLLGYCALRYLRETRGSGCLPRFHRAEVALFFATRAPSPNPHRSPSRSLHSQTSPPRPPLNPSPFRLLHAIIAPSLLLRDVISPWETLDRPSL